MFFANASLLFGVVCCRSSVVVNADCQQRHYFTDFLHVSLNRGARPENMGVIHQNFSTSSAAAQMGVGLLGLGTHKKKKKKKEWQR